MIYQFKVSLSGTRPLIWRRFQVDGQITFEQLHQILQIVMGWENSHLYEFDFGKKSILIPNPDFPSEGRTELDARKEQLDSHLRQKGQTCGYIYDFGDYWVHELVLENILPPEDGQPCPVCLEGERQCPPEDSGGVPGYEYLVDVLRDPRHPEYQDMLEWTGEDFDPARFDLQAVNRQLQRNVKRLNPKNRTVKASGQKTVAANKTAKRKS